jgi:hypothetical protein
MDTKMELETSTIMMFFFLALLIISVWKIYVFLPRERLADDDTTQESQEELSQIMLEVIYEKKGLINEKELFEAIKAKESFDTKHYWRFNQNRLKQLLSRYYLQHPDTQSIMDIYKKIT